MSDDFAPIEQLVRDLLVRTAPPERARLLRTIAPEVRRGQGASIAAQREPDGTAFAPRRPKPQRPGKGRLRAQKMFRKLRLARNLKAGATADEAWIGFAGRAARIAGVHQEGGSDAPGPGQAKVRYARRILLGLTDADRDRVIDAILAHVAPR
jgi:phage virion morphogenesis protein